MIDIDDVFAGKADLRREGKQHDWRAGTFTAAALQQMRFPEAKYAVPGLIPEGLTILAGRPKLGKSWMAFEIAAAISANRICLGSYEPEQGDVLYAAMEDNPRRLQRRLDKILPALNGAWPDRLTLTTSWRRLDKGGVDDIAEWARNAGNPRLVILDTLAGVKPIRTQQGYELDYAALEGLHRLANDIGMAIVVLHHTRKMEAEDPLDTVSGTLGLAGCADTIMVIARNSQGTTLYIRGRDVEEAEHALTFDKASCRWAIVGAAAEVHRSEQRGAILAALESSDEPMGPQDIAAATRQPVTNIKFLLHKMMEAGEVEKEARGRYLHPRKRKPQTPANLANSLTLDREGPETKDINTKVSEVARLAPLAEQPEFGGLS
ncbi:AAA family ATPase [Mesorhizobium newzealandense]|uniref:AAA family ATPase n=1 Tax=Mesorhizobium newzealandense TaxID=1300302 RepID=A0ABW4ULI1_9HYPH